MADHVFLVGESFLDDGYSSGCSCGWEHVGTFDTFDNAEDAWENHCDVVFMEATGG